MTLGFGVKILFEVVAVLLIVYGILNEDKLIEFETEMRKIIKFCFKKYVFKQTEQPKLSKQIKRTKQVRQIKQSKQPSKSCAPIPAGLHSKKQEPNESSALVFFYSLSASSTFSQLCHTA
ncbi:MAG: hypothetical protein GX241_03670 [Ruminococcaceae bacterium]|nr:hypothetical protein [Oscillospiraceae bacterium]